MNRPFPSPFARALAVVAGVITVASSAALAADGAAASETGDYSSFRIIAERNIFNAARSGRSSAGPRETRRQPRVESFALVGIMSYEKGQFAFFDGSSPDFRKALKCGDVIAGHTLREITPKAVRLELQGKTVDLRINTQMKREDDGPWRASTRTESYQGSGDGGGSSRPSSGAAPASSGGSSGDVSEVLKRLMEQREKEMK